jgi:hypothetical protein
VGQDLLDELGFRDISKNAITEASEMVTGVQDLRTNITPLTPGVVVEAPHQDVVAMSDVATNPPIDFPAKAQGQLPPAAPTAPQPRVQITPPPAAATAVATTERDRHQKHHLLYDQLSFHRQRLLRMCQLQRNRYNSNESSFHRRRLKQL